MRKYVPFILIIILMLIIFGFSAVDGSVSYSWSEEVARFIKRILTSLGDKNYSVTTIDLIIRKLAHFFEYLILTILLTIGIFNISNSKVYSLLISSIVAIIVSLIDEGVVQTVSGRNNSLFDVFIDCTGIIAGLIVFFLSVNFNIKIKK